MAWKSKKKPKKLSYADLQFVKKLIEDSKAKRKSLRGYAVLKRTGSDQDLKISGSFKDEIELHECAKSFAEELCRISSKKWNVIEVQVLSNVVHEDENDEYNINYDE